MTPEQATRLENSVSVLSEVKDEVARACAMYKPMASPHEAYSVLLEEVDEFWDEVKAYNLRKGRDTRPRMREELIQVAAMAIRAITDVIDDVKPDESLPYECLCGNAPHFQSCVVYNQRKRQEASNGVTEQVPALDPQAAGK